MILRRINVLLRRRAHFLSVHRHDGSGLIVGNPVIRGVLTGARR
jgi:hypothetical protein